MFGFTKKKPNRVTDLSKRRKLLDIEKTQPMNAAAPLQGHDTLKGYRLDFLPAGIIIKRIFQREGSNNKWRISYQRRSTEYYGPTLDIALRKFFNSNDILLRQYNANALGVQKGNKS